MKPCRRMWMTAADGQVGVVNGIREDGMVEFHRIGVEGLTEIVLFVDRSTLRQSTYAEIPESRRPPKDLAEKFGYL